jgi:hypothetical protein
MQRSSQSIAALAAALAKAQIELANPQKSLVGTIAAGPRAGKGGEGGGAERLFRYASLADGLEIVRKALGQHEIATVQTTAIDQATNSVNLTTVLAHSSGEWIASDWPICAIADTAEPHRMGAALTYARRYGLFTLVGIAGEDDLDAPDLITPRTQAAGSLKQGRNRNGGLDRHRPTPARAAVTDLSPEGSAKLRDRLLAEMSYLVCSDDAALWAHRSLGEKNRLTAADAKCVEDAFQTKLRSLGASTQEVLQTAETAPNQTKITSPKPRKRLRRSKLIDKSVLALSEPRRICDRDHVRYVAQQPCLICGRQPSDPHHSRFTQTRALGRKVSDEFTVPLCRGHHREVHHSGEERAWWRSVRIDPTERARTLWLETHPLISTSRVQFATPANDVTKST